MDEWRRQWTSADRWSVSWRVKYSSDGPQSSSYCDRLFDESDLLNAVTKLTTCWLVEGELYISASASGEDINLRPAIST